MDSEFPVIRDLLRLPGASPPAPPGSAGSPGGAAFPWAVPVPYGDRGSRPPADGSGRAPDGRQRPDDRQAPRDRQRPDDRQGPGDRQGPDANAGRAQDGRARVVGGARAAARAARRQRRGTGPLAVVIVLVGVFVTGIGLGQATGTFSLPRWFGPEGTAPPREFPVLEPSRPTRIKIASLGVDASVHGVGIAEDGTIEVPAVRLTNEAGWYDESPTPGQFGPAILVGHVDTRTGPAVFHKLRDVRPGARIEVTRRDRSVAVFEVNTVESFDKTAIPVDRVYGDFSRPGLRLITCGGRWVGGATGYADNVIVFASLVSARNVKT
jgi:hypothetical protein